MDAPDRRGLRGWAKRIGVVIAVIAVIGAGVNSIRNGTEALRIQLSGTPAQVKLDGCKRALRSRYFKVTTCKAVWQPNGETPRTVTVKGVRLSVMQKVNVHIDGDQAFTDSYPSWRDIALGIGLILLVPVIWFIRRWLMSREKPD